MSVQLSLFLDRSLERNRLLRAITRLDHREARALAEEFLERWPQSRLSWELELIDFAEQTSGELDLDRTYDRWREFASSNRFSEIPEKLRNAVRVRFFSRALEANQVPSGPQITRTRQGRSLGEFLLLADRPEEAVRSFEQERKEHGDDWSLSLAIGNCHSKLGAAKAAHGNYRRAFFLGLPVHDYDQIEDPVFQKWLAEVDEDWPFAEVLLRREMRPMRFGSRAEFEEFTRQFPIDRNSSPEWQFCRWFAISENRDYCDEALWHRARKRMKSLHPRLHARYMKSLQQS